MARRRWRKHRRHDADELNITAFMNLMVALVPFLLITAVFSRMSILELNLPGPSAETVEQDEPEFRLEIVVRRDTIEVGERSAGILRRFGTEAGEYDLDGLSDYLLDVKRRFPDKLDATLLLEPDVSYEHIVAVMDRVRAVERFDERSGRPVMAELFPEISIGDAPLAAVN
ncbi:MAG TPA: biopolymer transporter ExbD [Gammaproteobacteria bacterium]